MRCAIAILIVLHLATSARAQIGLYNSEDGSALFCNNIDWSGSPQDVYILVTGEWKSARFSISSTEAIIPLDLQPLNGTTISGDFSNGFTLNFSECSSDRREVARLTLVTNYVPVCGYGLGPHPLTGYVELVDCSGQAVPAAWLPTINAPGGYNSFCDNVGVSPLPRAPYPPNGAVDVPTNVNLSWIMDPPVGSCVLSWQLSNLYLGTAPTPPLLISDIEGQSQHIDGLQPGTTYYWKVWVFNYGFMVWSPVWSFTTVSPVSAAATTWGRVKSLYR